MRIHFIGIGGIGVSALAKYYLEKGYQITGSDLVSSEITEALKKLGAKITIGKHKRNCLRSNLKQGLPQLVIYSSAVPSDNLELKEAKKLGIKCRSYPEGLGELTKKYFTIAVSGTHGKSTTAAMIGLLLTKAGLDPTVIVGTKLKEFGNSNCQLGKSNYLVIEADEYGTSFLNYWPKIIILTTIEADHLDYYKNLKNILKTFGEYVSHLPKNGSLVANRNDRNILKIIDTNFFAIAKNIVFYSLRDKEVKKLKDILKIPGEHNVSNALASLAVARILKIPDEVSFKSLSEYKGSWRRFEIEEAELAEYQRRKRRKIIIVNDYAHHPTEIKVTLKTAREKYPRKKIWCVYQPHQYQRTHYLFNDFVKVFKQAPVDKLIITDIYDVTGREESNIKKKVNSEKLVKAIEGEVYPRGGLSSSSFSFHKNSINKNSLIYLPKEKIIDYLKKNLKGGEAVIIMGAGDIYKIIFPLTDR